MKARTALMIYVVAAALVTVSATVPLIPGTSRGVVCGDLLCFSAQVPARTSLTYYATVVGAVYIRSPCYTPTAFHAACNWTYSWEW
jgi:hypothetical protein